MPEPRTLEEQQVATVEDHERRLRKLESLECPISGLIPWGQVGCTDLTPLLGDFGICNGQFELGPTATHPVACNWIEESLGGTGTRVTGGVAGDWCIKLESGTGTAVLRYDRYLCVWESRDYYIACHANGPNGTETFQLGAHCYDANKVFLATVWAHNGVVPAGWDPIQRRIGPNGDVAWPQGTRYCRPLISAGTKDETIYVDDVQFQQMKMAYSPGIRFMHGVATDTVLRSFAGAGYTLYPNSAIVLTLEEPGFIWIQYGIVWVRNASAIRTMSFSAAVYLDGAIYPAPYIAVQYPSYAIDAYYGVTVCGVTTAQPAGAHTVDLRIQPTNAADTIEAQHMHGYAYYTRQF